jgi:hypothetical protein
MKHVGKMKNNGARVIVAYRTLPGDAYHALVIGTGNLGDSYHDSLMTAVQSAEGQQAYEFAETLAVRKFTDGSTMLEYLHTNGHLKKVPTDGVLMTPTPQTSVSLDELNAIIAEQKGMSIDELALTDGVNPNPKSSNPNKANEIKVEEKVVEENLTPAQLRSKADALFKQAQQLRKQADEIDPPKSKKKSAEVEA